jgi:hypothetical protein
MNTENRISCIYRRIETIWVSTVQLYDSRERERERERPDNLHVGQASGQVAKSSAENVILRCVIHQRTNGTSDILCLEENDELLIRVV